MPVLQLDDQQFPLKAGATRIGAGNGADVVVPGYSDVPVEAIIDGGGSPTIRRADDSAHVRVNGVLLGAEPTPLMHGDKIEVAGLELRYADDAKGGATQFQSAGDIAAMLGNKRTGAARATAASGGRLVSLVDGKEYTVADSGLVVGRDASCDVVIAQHEVSRRHAEIQVGDDGYVLRDTSANGVYVNGERVQVSQTLVRADVLRIGTEEFRFYADVLSPARGLAAGTPSAAAPALVARAPVAPAVVPDFPSFGEVEMVPMASMDMHDMDLLPATPASAPVIPEPVAAAAPAPPRVSVSTPMSAPAAADPRTILAVLEAMNEGPGKGTRYEMRSSLAHVGRGAHNDVRLSDESVSETHAKLQKREDGWYVVDMDSTNGTYVGGSRVNGERKIEGSPDLRFGGLKFRFTPTGAGSATVAEAKGTRAIAAMAMPPAAPTPVESTAGQAPAARDAASSVTATSGGGMRTWIWIVVGVVVGLIVAFFLLKGRA
ncbi:MAG: FHA domain-containing protein [Gemmatimonadota bacterium]|nr:FHA domain-containing protein [Gemmatimonadota bacterium]